MGYVNKDITELIESADEYLKNVSKLYEKQPKEYISKVGISHSKLITKLRKIKRTWANTTQTQQIRAQIVGQSLLTNVTKGIVPVVIAT